ncbi:MAG: Crp/Fnr family transcriptional regulator [Myxococcales bacterium]|nr:Crp/Fnr family transcriptional regulator [Myxococcales bacterium]MCB9577568.1 Crp/Fnr family transcriptional regulator [Polyangiaceae bacterium]
MATSADEQQDRLLARFGRRFSGGEVLFTEGEVAREAFLLQEGRVRLIKKVGAVERSLRVLRPGDLFGESALLQGANRNSTAVALSDGVALALDHATFQHVLTSNSAVGMRVLQQLVRRLRDAEDQIEILMVRDSKSKVVVALTKLAQQTLAAGAADVGPVELAVSPMELSTRVGLDVDSVKRTVQELRDAGYVRIVDERIEIPDADALRELYGLLGLRDQLAGTEDEAPARNRRG